MEAKRLMKVTYQDLKKGIRLNAYADAVIWSEDSSPTLAGLRFGGYAEVVRGLTDAIYGGATIEIEDVDGSLLTLKSLSKQYHREVSHEGLYAEATLIAEDEIQESSKSQDEKSRKHAQKDDLFDDNVPQQDIPAHICYIFCHPGNEDELFQAIDQKSYVPMIPEYQDYVLAELKRRRILRPLRVRSLYQELEAWKLCCEAKDQNLVRVMEDGLKRGKIKIPGASPGPSLLDGVHSVTDYWSSPLVRRRGRFHRPQFFRRIPPSFLRRRKLSTSGKKGKSMKISFSYSKLHRKEGKHHARTCKP